MTLKEFKRYAEAYGADLDSWPRSARVDALALLDDSAEARDLQPALNLREGVGLAAQQVKITESQDSCSGIAQR